jgi:hypothetical protein
MSPIRIVFEALIVLVAIGCAIVAVRFGRARTPVPIVVAVVLGLLAGLAPISLVVFFRTSFKDCIVVNVLGLPWPGSWETNIHWIAGAIWAASTVLLLLALVWKRVRRAAVVLWICTGILTIPTAFLLFLTVFGDTAAGCVPL